MHSILTILPRKMVLATLGIALALFTAPPAQANDGCHLLYERYDQSDRIVVPSWEVMKLTFMSCKATSGIRDRPPATDVCDIRNIMNRGIKTRHDAAYDKRIQRCIEHLQAELAAKLAKSSPLLTALTSHKPPNEIAHLIEDKAAINITDALGNSVLHYALRSDHSVEMTVMLLAAGADPNLANRNTDTPLGVAIEKKMEPAVLYALIKGGAKTVLPVDPDIGRRSSFVAATDALRAGYDRAVVDKLIDSKMTAKQTDHLLYSILLHGSPEHFVDLYDATAAPFSTGFDTGLLLFRVMRSGNATLPVTERLLAHTDPDSLNKARSNVENVLEAAFKNRVPPEVILTLVDNGALIQPKLPAETVLYYAIAEQTDDWLLRQLLAKGMNPNHVFEQRWRWKHGPVTREFSHFPLLHTAMIHSRGSVEKAQALIDAGADPKLDCDGKCWTTEAFLAGPADRRTLAALLNAGFDPLAIDAEGNNFLHLAALYHNFLIIPDLIKYSVDTEQRNAKGQTPLWTALEVIGQSEKIGKPHTALLQALLDAGAKPMAPGPDGEQALAAALRIPNGEKIVGILLGHGLDLNSTNNDGVPWLWSVLDITPFNTVNFQQLVEQGADKTTRNALGQTMLEAALEKENAAKIVPTLISNQSDILGNSRRGTPLLTEVLSGKTPIEEKLTFAILDSLASKPEFQDFSNRDALMPLVFQNQNIPRPELAVLKLAKLGLNVNAPDDAGDTPLHIAVSQPQPSVKVVKTLIENGADVTIRNAQDNLAFQIIKQQETPQAAEIQMLLTEAGGSTNFIKEWQHRGILFYIILGILLGGLAIVEAVRMIGRRNAPADSRLPRVPKTD